MEIQKNEISRENEDNPRHLNPFHRLVLNHYRQADSKPKTLKQISAEKWLLPFDLVPFNRWMCMPAAVALQFCVGSLYAFSVLNKPIELYIFQEIRNVAPITFYMACGSLGICTMTMGPWIERNGPRAACLLGTILFCSGHFLTALALYLKQIWLVFIAYGIIGGCGIGLCYISPISVLQKWFPDRRGLASGFAISGFGAGSIALAKVQTLLMEYLSPPMTFVTLGTIYFFVMTMCSFVLRTPPPDFSVKMAVKVCDSDKSEREGQSLSLIESIRSRDFGLIYLAFIASVLFGLCAMSRLSNMVIDIFAKSAHEASTIVSVNGAFNLGGRIGFSFVSDYLGRKNCFVFLLTIQLIMVAIFSTITSNGAYIAFVAIMWISTACYGGISAIIPALLTDRFGAQNVAACMGIQMSGWSLAAVAGGLTFTAVFDAILASGYTTRDAYPYNLNSWWILVIVVAGWIALFFVKRTEKDLNFWRQCRKFFGRICTCRNRGIV